MHKMIIHFTFSLTECRVVQHYVGLALPNGCVLCNDDLVSGVTAVSCLVFSHYGTFFIYIMMVFMIVMR